MSRPGFTLEVDDRTGSLLVVHGTRVSMQKYPVGTQIVYPGDPQPVSDATPLVEAALVAPLGQDALAGRLTPTTRLTIVVGDGAQPRPPMTDDVRRVLVEQVLTQAAAAGVADVAIVVATGLRRRLSDAELTAMLGERAVRSFAPSEALLAHDVTADDLAVIGEVDGREVRVHPRLAASDLVVNLAVRTDLATNADDQLVLGLTDAETIDQVNGLDASPEHRAAVAAAIHAAVPVLTVEATLGQPALTAPLAFVSRREWNWGVPDKLALGGVQQALARFPKQATQRVFGDVRAAYAVVAVTAGDADRVTEASRKAWLAQHGVQVPKQADVLVASVWGRGSDPTAPAGDPLMAAHHALVAQGESFTGTPPVRDGGVFVGVHPLRPVFSTRHHSAAADFFADVLSQTTDPAEIRARHQDAFTSDPWYLDLYRNRQAYHPMHTFHRWYATVRAAAPFAHVIWVGADRDSAARMGHRAASTYGDALEIATDAVGRTPVVTVVHTGAQVALELS